MATNGQRYSVEQEAHLAALMRNFITGCHVMHKHDVLDAYGHMSLRHPYKPDVFFMSRYIAPGTISSRADLQEYWVKDATPVDPNALPGYSERCIHSEILKAYPEINVVVHSHTEAVTPYSISGVPFLPCTHQAGFLGNKGTPVFEIAPHYKEGDIQNMLINSTRLGAALAKEFSPSGCGKAEHTVVLMRGHGLTIVATRIEDAVKRAIYIMNNAHMQTIALNTRASYLATATEEEKKALPAMRYLEDSETEGAAQMTIDSAMRPWKLWVREVEADPLYVNQG